MNNFTSNFFVKKALNTGLILLSLSLGSTFTIGASHADSVDDSRVAVDSQSIATDVYKTSVETNNREKLNDAENTSEVSKADSSSNVTDSTVTQVQTKIENDTSSENQVTVNKKEDSNQTNVNDNSSITSTQIDNQGSTNSIKVAATTSNSNTTVQLKSTWYYDESNTQWFYYNKDGKKLQHTWFQSPYSGNWFYFNQNGEMTSNSWLQSDWSKKWYYFNKDGAMISDSWLQSKWSKNWFYFEKSGAMVNDNWLQSKWSKNWFYLDKSGAMINDNWLESKWSKSWFYLDKDGTMINDSWLQSKWSKNWFYFSGSGTMLYGWQQLGRSYYYFNTNDGSMFTGTHWINGKKYTFSSNGTLNSFTQRTINWFVNNIGKIKYSMMGSRNGNDGTADCSGAMTQALVKAGASTPDATAARWGGYNTVSIRPYLIANGYQNITNSGKGYVPQYGDIVIWGDGLGAAGHIMIVSSSSGADAKVISVCAYMTDKYGNTLPGQAVQEFNYSWYWSIDEIGRAHV